MPVRILTPPAEEPISLAEARAHLRVDHDDEDDLIGAMIAAARDLVEGHTHRALVTRTLEATFDHFPGRCRPLRLDWPPAGAVTGITYVDGTGTGQTWPADQYQADTRSTPARILPVPGGAWPCTRDQMAAVTVTYTAGYGAAADVPDAIKAAIKLLVGSLYANRDEPPKVEGTVAALLSRYVVHEVA